MDSFLASSLLSEDWLFDCALPEDAVACEFCAWDVFVEVEEEVEEPAAGAAAAGAAAAGCGAGAAELVTTEFG